jgi:hypothetical protein
MTLEGVLRVVLYLVGIALAGAGVWAVVELVGTARSVKSLTDELGSTLPPLIERANLTLDNMNAELARMDGVVTQLEEVSDRVNSTTRAAQEIVEAPAAAVSGLGAGMRAFFTVLTGKKV